MQEYTSGPVPAGPRGNQSAALPPLGRPGMVHPHPNYGLSPAEGFHSAGGHLAYGHGGLTQLMQMNRVSGGDLGPPLFMPGEQMDRLTTDQQWAGNGLLVVEVVEVVAAGRGGCCR